MKSALFKRLIPLFMLTSTVGIGAIAVEPATAGPCGLYVSSARVLSKSYTPEKIYLTNTYLGPITINVEWGYSKTNTYSYTVEILAEAASLGFTAEYSVTTSQSEGASYNVSSGRYGRIYLFQPKWTMQVERQWKCGSTLGNKDVVTRTYRTEHGKYIAGEQRTTWF